LFQLVQEMLKFVKKHRSYIQKQKWHVFYVPRCRPRSFVWAGEY